MEEVRSTTTESLLGLLSLRPMSGYEMRNVIEGSIGHFWREGFGQIYPALKRMQAAGLVEASDSPQGGRPRTVYSLTDAGRERLEQWLGMPVRDQVPRNELLLKLFFGATAGAEQARKLLLQKREDLRAELARYEAIERDLPVSRAGQPGLPYWLITVRYGKAQARALLAWCEESLQAIEEKQ